MRKKGIKGYLLERGTFKVIAEGRKVGRISTGESSGPGFEIIGTSNLRCGDLGEIALYRRGMRDVGTVHEELLGDGEGDQLLFVATTTITANPSSRSFLLFIHTCLGLIDGIAHSSLLVKTVAGPLGLRRECTVLVLGLEVFGGDEFDVVNGVVAGRHDVVSVSQN